ncbi:hypothetical protein [Amycolatopsis sp. WAC 04197]|uniref:hypothetical protein n=1 Tax=Amycolatopsis sp. WAC 04197 TaxID=2203199 RepID=UPI0013151222|nr:hypothetical protein [Amycolatopsis sp. WAC 04197]
MKKNEDSKPQDSASADMRGAMADAQMFGRWVDAAIEYETTQRGIEDAQRHANGGGEW